MAEGLKTLEVLYYLSVVAVSLYKSIGLLWVVSRWSIIAEKIVKTACLKIQISSYRKEISSKISKKISWRRVWLHSTVPVTTTSRENEMRKGKEIFGQKNHSIWLLSKLSWLFGLFWNKKTGCRRRIVNTEDLVAEDKPRLVSSCSGPSCRYWIPKRGLLECQEVLKSRGQD